MYHFWVENLSNLCSNLLVLNKHSGFQNIGSNTHNIQLICTHNMHGVKPITAENSPTARRAELHKVKSVQF